MKIATDQMPPVKKRCTKGHEWEEGPFDTRNVSIHIKGQGVFVGCLYCVLELAREHVGEVIE